MIANSAGGGSNFGAAIGYVMKEEKLEQWEGQNIIGNEAAVIGEDMHLAVEEFNSERSEYHSVSTPVYHVTISWAEADSPTHDQKMQVGRAFLNHMGLVEHQAIIASHNDKPYDHIHVVANRVNPKTQQLWNPYIYDGKGPDRHIVKGEYQRHEEVMRAAEARYGWEPVQGVHVGNPARDFDRRRALTQGEYHFQQRAQKTAQALGMPDADTRPIKVRAAEIKDDLFNAGSFAELDKTLATNGLYIESKGQGAVISDGSYSVKASSISRGLSGPKLEAKFGERLATYEQSREGKIDLQKGKDIAHEFIHTHREKVGDAVAHQSHFNANSYGSRIITLEKFNRELTPARMQFRDAVATTFVDPEATMEQLGVRAEEVGMARAADELLQNPSRFGNVVNRTGAEAVGRSMEKAHEVLSRYSNYITSKTDSERAELINNHKAHKQAWNTLKGKAQQMANQAMRESQGGEAVAGSAAGIIATNRALQQIVTNPRKASLQQVQQILSKAQGKMQQESGAAVGSIMGGVTRSGQTVKHLLTNPTRGSMRLLTHVITGGQRAAGRASPGMERSL